MSTVLMVFDQKAPSSDRSGFLAWYGRQTLQNEAHSYNNPNVSTPELRSWFLEIISGFLKEMVHTRLTILTTGKCRITV